MCDKIIAEVAFWLIIWMLMLMHTFFNSPKCQSETINFDSNYVRVRLSLICFIIIYDTIYTYKPYIYIFYYLYFIEEESTYEHIELCYQFLYLFKSSFVCSVFSIERTRIYFCILYLGHSKTHTHARLNNFINICCFEARLHARMGHQFYYKGSENSEHWLSNVHSTQIKDIQRHFSAKPQRMRTASILSFTSRMCVVFCSES